MMVISLEGLGEPSGSPKIHTHNRLLSDRGSHNLSAIVLVRVFRGRNLWRQRKNALIVNRQYLEQSPLSGIGKRRPLVLPEIITDDFVRCYGDTGEVGVDDLG